MLRLLRFVLFYFALRETFCQPGQTAAQCIYTSVYQVPVLICSVPIDSRDILRPRSWQCYKSDACVSVFLCTTGADRTWTLGRGYVLFCCRSLWPINNQHFLVFTMISISMDCTYSSIDPCRFQKSFYCRRNWGDEKRGRREVKVAFCRASFPAIQCPEAGFL